MGDRFSFDDQLASAILHTVGAVVCVLNTEGKIVFFNKACENLTGYMEKEALNRCPWEFLVPSDEIQGVKDVFKSLTMGHFPNQHVNCWLTRHGEPRLISWSNTALADEYGNLAYVIATGIDITEQRKAEEQIALQQKDLERLVEVRTDELRKANQRLKLLVNQDELTGLFNRRYLNNALDGEIRRARRYHFPLSILMCDIDYFKNYNDFYGHVAGDKCLQNVAALFSDHFQRASDLVARYGGEEFCVVLPDTETHEAQMLAEQLRESVVNNKFDHKASHIADYVTISIGVVGCVVEEGCVAEVLLESADRALYQAKKSGRNQVVCGEIRCPE